MTRKGENAIGHTYEVWAEIGQEWPDAVTPRQTALVASFMYFQEALDYRDYAAGKGVFSVVRSHYPAAVYPARKVRPEASGPSVCRNSVVWGPNA